MDKILSIQTIKNVFAALGAKTSDDNYGVALLDKTTAEPKGLMSMSDLAKVLGAYKNLGSLGTDVDLNEMASENCVFLAYNGLNHPAPNEWTLFRVTIALNGYSVLQEAYDSHGNNTKTRIKWENNWTAWRTT